MSALKRTHQVLHYSVPVFYYFGQLREFFLQGLIVQLKGGAGVPSTRYNTRQLFVKL